MHEYGLMQDVVNLAIEACRRQGAAGVALVRIEVGEFAVADRESLETAYEILGRGTPLEHSRLELVEVPGWALCGACGFQGTAKDLGDELSEPPALLLCPRCASPLFVKEGAGLTVVDVQLTDRGHLRDGVPMCEGR